MRRVARGWIVLLVAGLWAGDVGADPPSGPAVRASDPANDLDEEVVRLIDAGRYADALALAERSLRQREAAPDVDHPGVARSLNHLAAVFHVIGQDERALPLLERALRINEAAFGPTDPVVAQSLSNLGAVLCEIRQYERALPLLERALSINETELRPQQIQISERLNNIAMALRGLGQLERATSFQERAVRVLDGALEPNHPTIATSLANYGEMLSEMGQYERALPLLERALRIREEVLRPTDPDVSNSLNNLALALHGMGQDDRALPLFERALHIRMEALGPNNPAVTNSICNLAGIFLAMGRYERAVPLFDLYLRARAVGLQSLVQSQSETGVVQFLRSLSAEFEAIVSLATEHPANARLRVLALRAIWLFKARAQDESVATVATLRRSSNDDDLALLGEWDSAQQRLARLPPATSSEERARLRTDLGTLEERLAQRSTALRERRELANLDALLPSVTRHLAADAALVELVAFRPFNARTHIEAEMWGAHHYAALILHSNGTHALVDLGESSLIDDLAQDLRDSLTDTIREPRDTQLAGEALYQHLFAPIRPLLHPGTHRLLLAPDGPLNLTPLHLMHDGDAWLSDRYTISYLTSGRDLLRERSPTDQTTAPTLVAATRYADPRWDLPGVHAQEQILRRLVPGLRVLDEAEATEEHLMALSAPRVLHIAAHGQFLRLRSGEANDPMQRGRLVLADAAPSLATRAEGFDGLATAAELMNLNLRGTRLVVLSACDTGRGDAAVGEGVFGLRRALQFAGTEALITTLWTIDERSGAEFTVALYEGLRAGMRSADAVARAMRLVRARHPDPFDWAPFILVGRDDVIDWAP